MIFTAYDCSRISDYICTVFISLLFAQGKYSNYTIFGEEREREIKKWKLAYRMGI
jgi:hypothetical protein